MTEQWYQRDLPVLKAVVDLTDEHGVDSLRVADIVARAELPKDDVNRALRALASEPYLELLGAWSGSDPLRVKNVTGAARRAVGVWPSPDRVVDQLVTAFTEAADRADSDEKRQGLRRAVAWIAEGGRDVLVNVLSSGLT